MCKYNTVRDVFYLSIIIKNCVLVVILLLIAESYKGKLFCSQRSIGKVLTFCTVIFKNYIALYTLQDGILISQRNHEEYIILLYAIETCFPNSFAPRPV